MPWEKGDDGKMRYIPRVVLEWRTCKRATVCRSCIRENRKRKHTEQVLCIDLPFSRHGEDHLCEEHGMEFLKMAASLLSQSKGASDEYRSEEKEARVQDGAEAGDQTATP